MVIKCILLNGVDAFFTQTTTFLCSYGSSVLPLYSLSLDFCCVTKKRKIHNKVFIFSLSTKFLPSPQI